MSFRSVPLPDASSSTRLNIPTNQFEIDAADGFTSSNFDLNENIVGDDTREGLQDTDKHEVRALMSDGHDFDSARLEMNRQRMREAGIDPDTGLPLDPRAVTFEDLRRLTDKSFKAKCSAMISKLSLTPRRVLMIVLLGTLAYWLLNHSDLRQSLGLVSEQWTVGPERI